MSESVVDGTSSSEEVHLESAQTLQLRVQQLEAEVENRETLLEAALDTMPAQIAILDQDGRLVRANKAWRESAIAAGVCGDDLQAGFNCLEMCDRILGVDTQTAEEFKAAVAEVLAGQRQSFSQDFPCTVQGDPRWFEGRVQRYSEGATTRIACIHMDITETVAAFKDIAARQRAEETLRRSEERFRAVFESAIDSIYIKDTSLRYTHVNPAMERLLGLPKQQLLGRTDIQIFGDEAGSTIRASDTKVLAGETMVEENTKPIAGENRSFHVVRTPLRNEDGVVAGVCGIARDVTERKRDQELLLKVAEGVSSAVGEEFFESLVRYVATALDSKWGIVAKLSDESTNVASSIAVFADGEYVPPFEYSLTGTPCKGVVDQGLCIYESGVAESYPDDTVLVDWGVECYIGTPLADSSGKVLGLLVIMDDKPLGERRERALALLQIFAVRAADELERRRNEATVISQNRFLNIVIESLAHPFYVIDAKTHSVRLTNSAGREAGAEGATTCYAMSHRQNEPCNGNDHPCPLKLVCETKSPVTVEHVHQNRHGQSRRYEIHGYPVFGESGDVEQMIEYAIDVTQRRAAEDQIRRRNRELMLLNWVTAAAASDMEPTAVLEAACGELAGTFDLPRVVVALIEEDSDQAVVVAEHRERGVASLLGEKVQIRGKLSYRHLVERKLPLVADDAMNDPRLESLREILQRNGTRSMLAVPLAIDAKLAGVLALVATKPRSFSSDEVNLAMSVAGQIAGSLSRSRLSRERRRLQTAIEQSVDSVLITDVDGNTVYVNPAFESTSGYSRDEVIGQNPRILKSSRHDEEFYSDLWRTITSGEVWRGRLTNRNKDGGLFTEDAVISPIRDDSGTIVSFVAVKRDVTREVQLEQQYLQAQKMEGIGRLAGGVAHDFNNLLGAIIGYAELTLCQIDEDHPLREALEEILAASENGANLTRQLLTFARRQATVRRPVRLSDVVAGIERMLVRLIGENIDFVTVLEPDLWSANVDPVQMEQVLMNLVINARDAMPDGGTLMIEISNLSLGKDDEHTGATGLEPGDYVRLMVSDSGVGMTEEVREHVFEPFFTTKGRGKGTGLGLATCFGIVTQSDGQITIDSEPGSGTSVSVLLPRIDEKPDASDEHFAFQEVEGGSETVLLAEDDFALRRLTTNVLTDLGYQVLEANDGVDAKRRAVEEGDRFDILVSDIVMPRVGGWELAGELRKRRPNLPVVFITGYSDNELPENGVLPQGTYLLQKPFSPYRLARLLRDVLDG